MSWIGIFVLQVELMVIAWLLFLLAREVKNLAELFTSHMQNERRHRS